MKIVVEKIKNRIYLRSPYRGDMPNRCKSIPGHSWANAAKAWTYPLDFETCLMLREEFKDELVIGPELTEWALNEKKTLSRLDKHHEATKSYDNEEFRKRVRTRVGDNAPKLFQAMSSRPYQLLGVDFLSDAKRAILGDQPGIGKTLESLGGVVNMMDHGRILVVAPSTSCSATWEPEIKNWLSDYRFGVHVSRASGLSAQKRTQMISGFIAEPPQKGLSFLIVNPEMIRWMAVTDDEGEITGYNVANPDLFNIEWDAIIADETHKVLINTTGKRASGAGRGMTKLKVKPEGAKFALSGTPLKGKPWNIWGTLNWLWPDKYTSKWQWIGRYFETAETGHGGGEVLGLYPHREESFHRSLRAVMLRRTKAELYAINPGWMPPEKRYHDVWLTMEPKQRTAYNAMRDRAMAELPGGQLSATGVLAEFTRLKQLAGSLGRIEEVQRKIDGFMETVKVLRPELPSAKFDWIVDFLEERGISKDMGHEVDEVRKVVIASQFTQQINLWANELAKKGIKSFLITGETKDRDRAKYQAMFQDKNQTHTRVFFINTNAGGVSITLDAADDIVLCDETWVPDEQEQVEDRVHRASDIKHQVDVWYLRTLDTIEEYIAKVGEEKSNANHLTLDAKRGLAYARTINWVQPTKETANGAAE